MSPLKEEAKRLIDELPDPATWDDVMYELYVKAKIARAVAAAESGDVVSHEQVSSLDPRLPVPPADARPIGRL